MCLLSTKNNFWAKSKLQVPLYITDTALDMALFHVHTEKSSDRQGKGPSLSFPGINLSSCPQRSPCVPRATSCRAACANASAFLLGFTTPLRSGSLKLLGSKTRNQSLLKTCWVVSDLTKVLTPSPHVRWQRRMKPSKRDIT